MSTAVCGVLFLQAVFKTDNTHSCLLFSIKRVALCQLLPCVVVWSLKATSRLFHKCLVTCVAMQCDVRRISYAMYCELGLTQS